MLTLFVLFTHIPFVYLGKAEEDKEKKKTPQSAHKSHNFIAPFQLAITR